MSTLAPHFETRVLATSGADHSWRIAPRMILTTFFLVLAMNIAHEAGHALAAKLLGYDVVAAINHVTLVPGAARSNADRLIIDLAGPLVTLLFAGAAWVVARRSSSFIAPIVLFIALAMRLIAATVSLGLPNDEARASLLLGFGKWTLFAIVIAILLALFVSAYRRLDLGWRWLVLAYVGASFGFAVTVFGEPYLPTLAF